MNTTKYLVLLTVLTISAAILMVVNANTDRVEQTTNTETEEPELIRDTTVVELRNAEPEERTEEDEGYFSAPVHGEITLSGTFAELRNNHFHGGLDIRTDGQQGWPVLAAADGFVARVAVSPWGYGKALYLQHPNGLQTVYGHLKRFDGEIQDAVVAEQYRREDYAIDWYPKSGLLKVKRGDTIAWRGNTGGSGGPHLHFEVRDGRTSEPLNPLLYGIKVKDTIPPFLRSLYLFKLDNAFWTRNGFYPYDAIGEHPDTIRLEPGVYGLGVRLQDYFVDHMSKLGVNYASLTMDGEEIFNQKIERFRFDEGKLINAHIDYAIYSQRGYRVVKLFKDEGNYLRYYTHRDKGRIELEDGDVHSFVLSVRDIAGQVTTMRFAMKCGQKGRSFTIRKCNLGEDSTFAKPSENTYIKGDYYKVSIPNGALIHSTWIGRDEYEVKSGRCSRMLRLHYDLVPFRKNYSLGIKPLPAYADRIDKLVMMSYDAGSRSSSSVGGSVNGDYVEAGLKKFGHYYLQIDTTAPRVRVQRLRRSMYIRVNDNLSGVDEFNAWVDGQWVLLEYEPKSSALFGTIPRSIGSGEHSFKLSVKDGVGNETLIERKVNL